MEDWSSTGSPDDDEGGMSHMKELLSSYYGVSDEASSNHANDPIASSAAMMEGQVDIDSTYFNGDIYFEDMLKQMRLPQLLKKDNELKHEIGTLDSEMQMLVYENYSKFITATDTIKKMKKNVDEMETEIESVVASMNKVTTSSNVVNEKLAPSRANVEKLVGVRRLLKRFEFLFQLPQRLNAAIKQEEFSKAAKYFNVATKILQKYSHISSFEAIQTEATEIIQNLCVTLRHKMNDSSDDGLLTNATLLLQLGLDDPVNIQESVLSFIQNQLEGILNDYQNDSTGVEVQVIRLKNSFLSRYVDLAKGYCLLFASHEEQMKSFENFTKTLFSSYFDRCTTLFQSEDNTSSSSSSYDSLIVALSKFIEGINEVDDAVPMRLADRAAEVVEGTIRFHVNDAFTKLHQRQVQQIEALHRDIEKKVDSYSKVISSVAATFLNDIEAVVHNMKPLVHAGADLLIEMDQVFCLLVQGQFQHSLQWLNELLTSFAEPQRSCGDDSPCYIMECKDVPVPTLNRTPRFILVLACVAREVATNGLSSVVETLDDTLPGLNHIDHLGGTENSVDAAALSGVTVAQVTHQMTCSADLLLRQYVEQCGQELSTVVRESVETLQRTTELEPRDVRPSIEHLLREIITAVRQSAAVLGENVSSFSVSSTSGGGGGNGGMRDFRSAGSGGRGVQLDIERIFANRISILIPIDFTLDSIVSGVLRITFKALFEYTRLGNFSAAALHQMQVDMEFIRLFVHCFVEEPSALETLLGEVVSTAVERSLANVLPMEPSVVAAITSTKKAQFKF